MCARPTRTLRAFSDRLDRRPRRWRRISHAASIHLPGIGRRTERAEHPPALPRHPTAGRRGADMDDWTPIEAAGPDGRPFPLDRRIAIIRRLQDGLLEARAGLLTGRVLWSSPFAPEQPKVEAQPDEKEYGPDDVWPITPAVSYEVETERENVAIPAAYWADYYLGQPFHEIWTEGEARMNAAPDGSRITFYDVELRKRVRLAANNRLLTPVELVEWSEAWISRRKAAGLGVGQNAAWADFRAEGFTNKSHDDFRPAFNKAKFGKSS